MKSFFICAAMLALMGCAYPTSSIEQGTALGHVRVSDAPKGTLIAIDGRPRGERTDARADIFDVEPGRHIIEETSNGRVLLHKEYFVGAGSIVDTRATQ